MASNSKQKYTYYDIRIEEGIVAIIIESIELLCSDFIKH